MGYGEAYGIGEISGSHGDGYEKVIMALLIALMMEAESVSETSDEYLPVYTAQHSRRQISFH
jgi:hypothetical protein